MYKAGTTISVSKRLAIVRRNELLITVGELAGTGAADAPTIIDCRFDLMAPQAGYNAYLEGHIPAAGYAHLDDDLAGPIGKQTGRHPLPSPEELSVTLRGLGVSNTRPVVVYDDSGGAMAARAWWLLRWAGHRAVRILDGGLPAWRRHKLPLEAGEAQIAAGDFEVRPTEGRVLTTEELTASPGSILEHRLVDARDSARYRGEQEPIDAVAGHIPGSRNLPFHTCLEPDGSWLPEDKLREQLSAVLGAEQTSSWAVMCGSGVTACHLAVSGLLAGYREPRLYAGSWSEWIRDPARPVAQK